jgi:hypothetical protein
MGLLRGLPPAHEAIVRRYRAALPPQRRAVFDILAVGAAAERAFDVALSAAPELPAIFREKEPP